MAANKIFCSFSYYHFFLTNMLKCSLSIWITTEAVCAVRYLPDLSSLCCSELSNEQAILQSYYCKKMLGINVWHWVAMFHEVLNVPPLKLLNARCSNFILFCCCFDARGKDVNRVRWVCLQVFGQWEEQSIHLPGVEFEALHQPQPLLVWLLSRLVSLQQQYMIDTLSMHDTAPLYGLCKYIFLIIIIWNT